MGSLSNGELCNGSLIKTHSELEIATPAIVKINGTMETELEAERKEGNIQDPDVEKLYPRRRISATHEFSLFCGGTASCVLEECATITLGDTIDGEHKNCKIEDSEEIAIVKEGESEADVKDKSHIMTEFGRSAPDEITEMECAYKQDELPIEMVAAEVYGGSPLNVRDSDSSSGGNTYSGQINQKDYRGDMAIRENVNSEILIYDVKFLDMISSKDFALVCDVEGIVQGLIWSPISTYTHVQKEEIMKCASSAKVDESDDLGGRSSKRKSTCLGNTAVRNKGFVAHEFDNGNNSVGESLKKRLRSSSRKGSSKESVAQNQDEVSHMSPGPKEVEVTLPPSKLSSCSEGSMRNKVGETLRLFHSIYRKILQGEEASSKQQGQTYKGIHLKAYRIIKEMGKEVNTCTQIIGAVPGVEVGDEFQFRVELSLVGIHRLHQAGIDYIKKNGMIICTSIVASGGYADELDNPDVFTYSGQGGMSGGKNRKEAEDQKLEKGNLALKNSITTRNHIRVVHGTKEKASNSNARAKMVSSYSYDGLYTVEKYWQEVGPNGKLMFKFELRRAPGQPEVAWKVVKKLNKLKFREGICVDDISNGIEAFPICAVNTVDDEKPPAFTYRTKMIYPSWYSPTPLVGCDCINGCSDSQTCSCVVRNGGEIPYTQNGDIVEAKPLVYECGLSCKCPPSCYNRVAQHGIKIQLEIFKTVSRGWGVRSLSSIPSGSFICEYIGELIEDKEAEQRCNDEYLFDIGKNIDGSEMNVDDDVEDNGFTIDAAVYGAVGRFINHSCSPNLYAQDVLYDHEDKSMPHVMFFAADNIPPLQELTYDYNYSIGQVRDSNGNVKTKSCYCGSEECTGRMY